MKDPDIVVIIFVSGKIVLTGGKVFYLYFISVKMI